MYQPHAHPEQDLHGKSRCPSRVCLAPICPLNLWCIGMIYDRRQADEKFPGGIQGGPEKGLAEQILPPVMIHRDETQKNFGTMYKNE